MSIICKAPSFGAKKASVCPYLLNGKSHRVHEVLVAGVDAQPGALPLAGGCQRSWYVTKDRASDIPSLCRSSCRSAQCSSMYPICGISKNWMLWSHAIRSTILALGQRERKDFLSQCSLLFLMHSCFLEGRPQGVRVRRPLRMER